MTFVLLVDVEPKRVRGPTRMLDVWEMEDGDVIIVRLDNHGRPIGNEATTLTRFIGSVVRRHQYAPISYNSWKDMPTSFKEEMLKLIERKFEFVPPINDSTREMIKFELNEKWRQWKSDLKSKAYDPSKTEDEVATAIPDDRVDPNQYRDLVHRWFSNEGQIKKSKGVVPRREEIYVETRTRKDGSIVNEKAARVIEELSRYSNEVGTSQSLQNTQGSVSWKYDLFSQVQGPSKKGHVRCMGKFPKSKISKVSMSENEELRDRVNHMENLLANIMTLIQNRFSGEDVNDIIQAARQIPDASSAPNNLNSPSSNNNEDNEKGED
uniref:Uncharacterized protein LOC105851333 n=1 Tax=Cicer arietinum TaxID=3827 RepID=A0A3Q7XK28_CICAR|nr:uncharacterized protein LOC105851333 [Cicer arietinum]